MRASWPVAVACGHKRDTGTTSEGEATATGTDASRGVFAATQLGWAHYMRLYGSRVTVIAPKYASVLACAQSAMRPGRSPCLMSLTTRQGCAAPFT